MSKTIDNIIAFKILYMLVTPIEKTDAYRLGIVDQNGKQLKKMKDLKTSEEKDAYTNLTKLVFNLKKLLAKVPGGSSQFASLVAAYWLIKESYTKNADVSLEALTELAQAVNDGTSFVEEELEIEEFLAFIEEEGAAIANTTGGATATDQAVVKLKNKKPVSGILGVPNYMVRRNKTNTKMG